MSEGSTEIRRPALRYHGGKWKLAPWIIEHFPVHRTYVEPFGGAGSVLLRKPRSYAEVYNDRWATVVDVFRVLRDPEQAAELRRRIHLTPFARDEFEPITSGLMDDEPDAVERARLTIYRSMAGFGSAAVNGEYATGFRANSNRSGTTPARDWRNYPDLIEAYTDRLRGVVIENREALDVMRQHDGPETLHYVDPPYPHESRNMKRGNAAYAWEMTDADHLELAKSLNTLTGMVVLSGYRCPLYDDLFGDWHRIDRKAFADGARERTESLWLNPPAQEGVRQQPLGLTHSEGEHSTDE